MTDRVPKSNPYEDDLRQTCEASCKKYMLSSSLPSIVTNMQQLSVNVYSHNSNHPPWPKKYIKFNTIIKSLDAVGITYVPLNSPLDFCGIKWVEVLISTSGKSWIATKLICGHSMIR